MIQAFPRLLLHSNHPRVVNIGTDAGSHGAGIL